MDSPLQRGVEVVRNSKYFSLSTVDQNGPWVAALGFNLIPPKSICFFSTTYSRHAQAIDFDDRVAGVFFDSHAPVIEADCLQFAAVAKLDHSVESISQLLTASAVKNSAPQPNLEDIERQFHAEQPRLYRLDVTNAYVLDLEFYSKTGLDGRVEISVDHLFAQLLTSG